MKSPVSSEGERLHHTSLAPVLGGEGRVRGNPSASHRRCGGVDILDFGELSRAVRHPSVSRRRRRYLDGFPGGCRGECNHSPMHPRHEKENQKRRRPESIPGKPNENRPLPLQLLSSAHKAHQNAKARQVGRRGNYGQDARATFKRNHGEDVPH